MTLYKRGRIFWAYITLNGLRHARSTGTGNRKLAETIGRKFEEELLTCQEGITKLQPEMKFQELAARFIAEGEVKPWHLERLKQLLPFWGGLPLRSITKGTVRVYRMERLKQKKLTEKTISHDLAVVRHLLFWAQDEGIVAANPLTRLRLPRARHRKRPVLSFEEEQKLLTSAAVHLKPIILSAIDTGMRRGELLTQRWEDVDFQRGLLSVSHSKTAEGEQREIPLTDRMVSLLEGQRKSSGLVFTFQGNAINRIKTAWKTALKKSGIRAMRFHDLRHTFNTRLLEVGIVADVRKALMGHSLGDDPHALYTHVELPLKRKAIQALNAWIWEQVKAAKQAQQHLQVDTGERRLLGPPTVEVLSEKLKEESYERREKV